MEAVFFQDIFNVLPCITARQRDPDPGRFFEGLMG
jgi:hypothetical protein